MTSRRAFLAAGLSAAAAPGLGRTTPTGGGDYAGILALAYGGPVDPLAAHRRALAQIRALQVRADFLLRGQGLASGSVAERLRALASDARWLYADDAVGRDRAVADLNAAVAALRRRLPVAFGDLVIPQAQARRMSPADVAAGKGGFREAPDEARPGAYYVDLRNIRERPAWSLPSVAFHELVPGHMLQLAAQAAACPPPARVKAAGAYFEAWGIYAEQLACDLGAYADDPRGEIGYLQWRLFRVGRIVADTGLHALGWSHDQAVATLTDLQGQSVAFITIEADVARIAATPGKYAAEGLGALSLRDWRPRRRAQWPAYHRRILGSGPWPFGDLRKRMTT